MNEELVLAGVEHPLSDVPVEERVGVVPLHREQLPPQVELPARRAPPLPRPRQAPAADVGYDGPQGLGAQLLDVAREVEAGAVEQLRLLLGQRTPAKEVASSFVRSSLVEDCPKAPNSQMTLRCCTFAFRARQDKKDAGRRAGQGTHRPPNEGPKFPAMGCSQPATDEGRKVDGCCCDQLTPSAHPSILHLICNRNFLYLLFYGQCKCD